MKSLVIASSRKYNEYLAKEIAMITGRNTHLITNNKDLNFKNLKSLEPEYIFFPHWSYIIEEEIINNFECIVFHMTDLPFGRGGSPLQNLILQGFKNTKISAFRCVHKLDAGAIYLKKDLNLTGTANEIYLRASEVIKEMIFEILEKKIVPEPQKGEPVIFKRREPSQSNLENAEINSLDDIFDFIRMLDADGYPKAFLEFQGYRVEFSNVKSEDKKLKGRFTIKKKSVVPGGPSRNDNI
ncbi:MAG: hypothetical protein KAR45_06605 [Desulfobacteraceae bacterium]|nr:hypothetical protein [Desulfobacteraceae bacterium]